MDVEAQVQTRPSEAGIRIKELEIGTLIEVKTSNRTYVIENRGGGRMVIFGHPKHCPKSVLVDQVGST